MAHVTYRPMSVEEAKAAVLTPPPSVPGRVLPGSGALLMAAAAGAAGFLLSNPRRARRLVGTLRTLIRSAMVKRALVALAASALGAKASHENHSGACPAPEGVPQ